jgi:hypothetical protein
VDARLKQKNLQSASGATINEYIEKQISKRYFNTTRFVGTARVGYGVFSVFATYQFNSLIKEGLGPNVQPFAIGLTLSGL